MADLTPSPNYDDLKQAFLSAPVKKLWSPKFFSKHLTGSGKTSGILCTNNDPANTPSGRTTVSSYYDIKKNSAYTNGDTRTYRLPMNPLMPTSWRYMTEVEIPIDTATLSSKPEVDVSMYLTAITLEETSAFNPATQSRTTSHITTPAYILRFFHIVDPGQDTATRVEYVSDLMDPSSKFKNRYMDVYTAAPAHDWNTTIRDDFKNNGNVQLDSKAFAQFLSDEHIWDMACKMAEIWQTQMAEYMHKFFINTQAMNASIHDIIAQVQYLMNYNIPLELYKPIYADIRTIFAPDKTDAICKENLNLLLSHTLNQLNTDQKNIPLLSVPANVQMPPDYTKLSPEQQKAVVSTDPLILVQAGAGTGKSTLILNRVKFLFACGIKPDDITVLSFTNAAADHITDKTKDANGLPTIHSMTIAKMIHTIYTTNFGDKHELSTLSTIENSLDIYFPQQMKSNSVVAQFAEKIRGMNDEGSRSRHKNPNAVTNMNNFVERHYDDVMNILDTIGQVSLELEIIICYQKIDTLVEPPEIASKYLIIDEVQDNSIFEFVYTLKYVDKHLENLFIVGRHSCSRKTLLTAGNLQTKIVAYTALLAA